MTSGYVQKTICWLLMEEGQLTAEGLHALADIQSGSLRHALNDLMAAGVVQREKKQDADRRPLYHFGLTRKGIEGALQLVLADVEHYLKGVEHE